MYVCMYLCVWTYLCISKQLLRNSMFLQNVCSVERNHNQTLLRTFSLIECKDYKLKDFSGLFSAGFSYFISSILYHKEDAEND